MLYNKLDNFDFLLSALYKNNKFQSLDNFFKWFDNKLKGDSFVVNEIPFEDLDQWFFEKNTMNLKHASGKFFSIEGISVYTNFGCKQKWEQPIIVQPEIGILGIITKMFNGIRYFLMQAKMEPGNVNIIQLSPTVQATKSNFTRVHNGKLPRYLDYFIDSNKSKVLIDQLQPEQGGRFYQKRNRNMIIEITDEISIENDFIWLTLAEIKDLLRKDNIVNMDARSVLATIPLIEEISEIQAKGFFKNFIERTKEDIILCQFSYDILASMFYQIDECKRFNEIISWISKMRTKFFLNVTRIPLENVSQWDFSDYDIKHESNHFFSIIAVKTHAGNREVIEWTQPMLKDQRLGLIGLLIKKINGVLHFLIQSKVEPGNRDIIELAPTISCSNFELLSERPDKPDFIEYFINPPINSVLYSSIQSEEGGRFYHFQNRNMLVLIDDSSDLEIPENYMWMTLAQIMKLMKFGYLTIEARSLISAINLI
ncbi:MAG: NDP-hexose 2,3-dehydratase family protein [Bacteroidia bacterium]|nr:NDP-hexose 2,3-dehydratase family protein [Bacteroidia bacterium]